MKTILLPVIFICFAFTNTNHSFGQSININDSLALVDLYNSTNGGNWSQSNHWLNGPVSTWYGVVVNSNRVKQLNLAANKLNGSLAASIGNLTALKNLDLSANKISGRLPPSIGNLLSLLELNLASNNLSGSIPSEITHLKALTVMELGTNKLSGVIPDSIGSLNRLTTLSFGINQLTGSIPTSIGKLTELTSLYLNYNKLTGKIPAAVGALLKLGNLYLSHNSLSGVIPSSLFNLSNIIALDLSYNQLSGALPKHIDSINNIGNLILSNNNLSGKVPTSTGNMKNVTTIDLSYNNFEGEFTFPRKTKSCLIYLQHNHFTSNDNVMINVYINWLGSYLVLNNNNYNFNLIEGIEKTFPSINFIYSPQADLLMHQTGNTLTVYAGGTLSNNTYKWFQVGSTDSVVFVGDSIFHPMETGRYYAKITNSIATALTLTTDTMNYVMASSVQTEFANNYFTKFITIWPNPATDILHIEGLTSNKTKLTVVDFAGNVKLQAVVNASSYNLNIASLTTGNYLLKIEMNGDVVTKKFVKD